MRERAGNSDALVRALLLAGGWWILTDGSLAGVAFGVPVVLLAAAARTILPAPPATRWRPIGLAVFAAAFLVGSLRGGIDVARRALAPSNTLSPAIMTYALRVPEGPARSLFRGALSLMPGTLTADKSGSHLEIHFLVASDEARLVLQLQKLEEQIARALGVPLQDRHG